MDDPKRHLSLHRVISILQYLFNPFRKQLSLVIHIGFIVCTAVLMSSGLRIAADNHRFYNSLNSQFLIDRVLPSNEVFGVHLTFGSILCLFVIAYIWRFFSKKEFRLNPGLSRANKLLNNLGVAILIAQCVVGFAVVIANQPGVANAARNLHLLLAIALTLYFFAHLVIKVASYGKGSLTIFFIGPGALFVVGGIFGIVFISTKIDTRQLFTLSTLESLPVSAPPVIDGLVEDEAWLKAKAKRITLNHTGDAFNANLSLEVKSVYHEDLVYFYIRWPDKEPSYAHVPLLKANNHWHALEKGFSESNETTFYEDKLAVMLAHSPFTALKSIHLGARPIGNAQQPLHKRGYHFLKEGIADVWQWKAWRTDSLFQADDNYFGQPITNYACDIRYTAGYQHDPYKGGGYTNNWHFYAKSQLTPKRLPKGGQHIHKEQKLISELAEFTQLKGMRWVDTFAYSAQLDTFPNGTIIPSHLTNGPIFGDRGNVKAKGQWRDGYWHLELQRLRNTGSEFDIPIQSGTYLWVSSFNHSQTHHSYHLRPLKIKLLTHND